MQKQVDQIQQKYNLSTLAELSQTLKMKLCAIAQRLSRYTKRSDQFHQNKLFQTDAKKFYRELNQKQAPVTEPPTQASIESFWNGILEDGKTHNTESSWIQREAKSFQAITPEPWNDFSLAELKSTLKGLHNWKAPGPDKLQNFWIKSFESRPKTSS